LRALETATRIAELVNRGTAGQSVASTGRAAGILAS
jgi:hypothetical protein